MDRYFCTSTRLRRLVLGVNRGYQPDMSFSSIQEYMRKDDQYSGAEASNRKERTEFVLATNSEEQSAFLRVIICFV
jgi:hypothetical protein